MRTFIATIILAAILQASSIVATADAGIPLCVSRRADLPTAWRPLSGGGSAPADTPWTRGDADEAAQAVEAALEEMIGYFADHPPAAESLWDDSVEALIQPTYSSANSPEFDARAKEAARRNLSKLISHVLDRAAAPPKCRVTEELLPLAIFAHKLFPLGDPTTTAITDRANAAMRACTSLEDMVGVDVEGILQDRDPHAEEIEDLFALHLWSLWVIEAGVYSAIELPASAREIGSSAWAYFRAYRLPDAADFNAGSEDRKFLKIADLATHIAHIPTGVHRYPLYIADDPHLYRFHRENFYAVLRSGSPDLLASFVDSLRQYGCTPENDAQVRDGSHHLLELFRKNGRRWMPPRPTSGESAPDHYAAIHRPWTAALGLRERIYEEPGEGTYGGIVRRWLRPLGETGDIAR